MRVSAPFLTYDAVSDAIYLNAGQKAAHSLNDEKWRRGKIC